jgi:hypothetical protein
MTFDNPALDENRLTFTNPLWPKSKLLAQLRRHRELNQIVQGSETSWDDDTEQGDAVGCTIHYCWTHWYPWMLGISQELATIENLIFDNLPLEHAVRWPEEFIAHIPENADVSHIALEMAFAEFGHESDGMQHLGYSPAQDAAIRQVIKLRADGCTDPAAWAEVRKAAAAEVGQYHELPADAANAAAWADIWRREAARQASYGASVAALAGGALRGVAATWMEPDTLFPWLQSQGVDPQDDEAVARRLHQNGVRANGLASVAVSAIIRSCGFARSYSAKAEAAEIAWRAGDASVAEKLGDEAEAALYVRIADRLKQRLSAAPIIQTAA